MSSTESATIEVLLDDDTTVSMSPEDFTSFLESKAIISSITTAIKVTRSIPRDKFEKNEYLQSNSTDVGVMYHYLSNNPSDVEKQALGRAIVNRVRKSFDLCRMSLKHQQEADALTVVNLAEKTQL